MPQLFLGLGTNLGHRLNNLHKAVDALEGHVGQLCSLSPVYKTEPHGPPQPDYLNAVAELSTQLSPLLCLKRVHEIERMLERKRDLHWGPRTIDIDILLYGQQILTLETLVIPHPRLLERRFVLKPLVDLAADRKHPVENRSFRDLLLACTDKGAVNPFPSETWSARA